MRTDRKGLAFWLPFVVLGWSLLLCVAALAGWGRGLPAVPADTSPPAMPALPSALAVSAPVLEEDSAWLQRPLFHSSRRPQPYLTRAGDAGGEGLSEMRLSGVVITPGVSLATLSGEGGRSIRLRLGGGEVQGWELLELSAREATVRGPQGVQTLMLAVHADPAAPVPPAQTPTAPRLPAPGSAVPLPSSAPLPGPSTTGTGSPGAPQAAARTPSADTAANDLNQPTPTQIQAIRDRIQARRQQMQQANASGQNTDGNP